MLSNIIWEDKLNKTKIYKEGEKIYLFIESDGYTAELPIKSKEDFQKYYKIWGFEIPSKKEKRMEEKSLF